MYQNVTCVVQRVNEGLSRWPSGLRRRLEGPFLFGGREFESRFQYEFEKIWRVLHTLKEKIQFFFKLFVTLPYSAPPDLTGDS